MRFLSTNPQELADRTEPKVVELTLLRRPPEQVEWLEHVAQVFGAGEEGNLWLSFAFLKVSRYPWLWLCLLVKSYGHHKGYLFHLVSYDPLL